MTAKSLVIGASAGLGRALAHCLARQGHELCIVSSDEGDLRPLASDLAARYGVSVYVLAVDLMIADREQVKASVSGLIDTLDNLFFVAGTTLTTDRGQISDADAERLLQVNFVSAVRLVNVFLDDIADRPQGNIVGMGSVAACRGRRNNAVYGAAKRGLEFYFETLRHYLVGRPCSVQFYRLGYLKTRMTEGQDLPFPPMLPEDAAAKICANLNRDLGTVYLPWWWRGITSAIQFLPWPVYRKLNF